MFFLLIFLLTQNVKTAVAQTLTRGPYLQMGNQTGVTIRWRSSSATNSRVRWGTVFGTYPNTVDSATVTTEHIVRITGLLSEVRVQLYRQPIPTMYLPCQLIMQHVNSGF